MLTVVKAAVGPAATAHRTVPAALRPPTGALHPADGLHATPGAGAHAAAVLGWPDGPEPHAGRADGLSATWELRNAVLPRCSFM